MRSNRHSARLSLILLVLCCLAWTSINALESEDATPGTNSGAAYVFERGINRFTVTQGELTEKVLISIEI